MPEENISRKIGLAFIAGFILALILAFWASPEFLDPYNYVNDTTNEHQSSQNTAEKQSNNEPEWGYWTRRLFAAEDTLAQWIMAIFTAAMTIFTGFAVYFIWQTMKFTRDTLKEAKGATAAAKSGVKETRRIGESQVRAYVYAKSMHVVKINKIWKCILGLNVEGVTPALNLKYAYWVSDHTTPKRVRCILDEKSNKGFYEYSGAIEKTGSGVAEIELDHKNLSRCFAMSDKKKPVTVFGYIEYMDVFERQVFSEFAFVTQDLFSGRSEELGRFRLDLSICQIRN